MTFEDLRQRILATSGKTRQDVCEDDMARAIKKLRALGGGFAVIPVGRTRLVQSVPGELNMDHAAVLQKAEVGVAYWWVWFIGEDVWLVIDGRWVVGRDSGR